MEYNIENNKNSDNFIYININKKSNNDNNINTSLKNNIENLNKKINFISKKNISSNEIDKTLILINSVIHKLNDKIDFDIINNAIIDCDNNKINI